MVNYQISTNIFNSLKAVAVMPFVNHPYTIIADSVKINGGTLVMPGVIINLFSGIGHAAICNSSSVIEHECTIRDFVHIGSRVVLSGNVSVGSHTFIGANSVVKQGVKVQM